MILDASSLIPALSFIIYIVFIVFGLYSRKDKVDGSFLQYMFFMALWSFGSFMMHANTGILTPLLWNKVMLMGLFGGPISFLATMIHLSGTEKRRYRVFLYAGYILYFFMAYLNLSSKVVTDAGFDADGFYYVLGSGAVVSYSLAYFFLGLSIIIMAKQLMESENRFKRKTLKLLIYGAVTIIGGVAVNLYKPLGRYPIDLMAATINAAIIFFAVYKYRLIHYSSTVLNILLTFFVSLLTGALFLFFFVPVFHLNKNIPFPESSFWPHPRLHNFHRPLAPADDHALLSREDLRRQDLHLLPELAGFFGQSHLHRGSGNPGKPHYRKNHVHLRIGVGAHAGQRL